MLTHGTYLIDTDVCIELARKNPIVAEHVRTVGASECKISNVTLAEMFFGAFKSGREKHGTFRAYPRPEDRELAERVIDK